MNSSLNLSDRSRCAADTKPLINIAVAFADELTHRIAKGVCSRIVRRVHCTFEVHAFWWSFESLDERDTLEHTAAVAARADMIFCSVYAQEELPGSAKLWANRWLARTRQTDAALVALLKTTGPMDGAPLTAEIHLRALARAARMDFFVKVFDQPVCETSPLSCAAKRASRAKLISMTGGGQWRP